jgi:hypothetical protein
VRNGFDDRYDLSRSLTEVILKRSSNKGNMACGSMGIRGEEKAKTMRRESVHAAADSTMMRAVNEKYDAMWRTSSSSAFFLACTSLKAIMQASTVFKTAVQISWPWFRVPAIRDILSASQPKLTLRRTLETVTTRISDVIFGRQKRLASTGEIKSGRNNQWPYLPVV